jgi:hypothetical protein
MKEKASASVRRSKNERIEEELWTFIGLTTKK